MKVLVIGGAGMNTRWYGNSSRARVSRRSGVCPATAEYLLRLNAWPPTQVMYRRWWRWRRRSRRI